MNSKLPTEVYSNTISVQSQEGRDVTFEVFLNETEVDLSYLNLLE